MKDIFKSGDVKHYRRVVSAADFASFHGQVVHPVYSTFALARDMEWTTRQFVIEMRDGDEEGIGTFVNVKHHAPAFEGEEIEYIGTVERMNGHELICRVEARVGVRVVATGETGQKIFKREKLQKILLKP